MNKPSHSMEDLFAPLRRLAKTSKAQLAGVACFIVKNGAIISSGVNYNPTGEAMESLVNGKLASRPEVIHAEVAALQAAERNAVDVRGATLVLNISPCIRCAHEIAQSGIADVCYLYDWWDAAANDILRASGVSVKKMKEQR